MQNIKLKPMYLFSLYVGATCVYLTFKPNIGVGLTIFIAMNSILFLIFLRKNAWEQYNKKALLWLIPVNLLSLSYLLRANRMFSAFNYIIIMLLLCAMMLSLRNNLKITSGGFGFLYRSFARIFAPLSYLNKPFIYLKHVFSGKKKSYNIILKICLGLLICAPLVLVVLMLLSSADVVFLLMLENLFEAINADFIFESVFDIIFAIALAIYVFCQLLILLYEKELIKEQEEKRRLFYTRQNINSAQNSAQPPIYSAYQHDALMQNTSQISEPVMQNMQSGFAQSQDNAQNICPEDINQANNAANRGIQPPVYSANKITSGAKEKKEPQDLIVLLMVNTALLIIYGFFAYVQINYLFMGASLPGDLTYAQYARQGFFELLILTFLNVFVLLFTMHFAKQRIYINKIKGSFALKLIMAGVCALTMFLLVSSFYRMVLYHNAYGLTRLRLLVMIFLAFEAVGLLVTFLFIFKANIKIIAAYTFICLSFYISVNLINLDGIIAKNHVDNYFNTGADIDFHYLVHLSADANSQLMRLNGVEATDIEKYNIIVSDNYHFTFNNNKVIIRFNCDEASNNWQSYNIAYSTAAKG